MNTDAKFNWTIDQWPPTALPFNHPAVTPLGTEHSTLVINAKFMPAGVQFHITTTATSAFHIPGVAATRAFVHMPPSSGGCKVDTLFRKESFGEAVRTLWAVECINWIGSGLDSSRGLNYAFDYSVDPVARDIQLGYDFVNHQLGISIVPLKASSPSNSFRGFVLPAPVGADGSVGGAVRVVATITDDFGAAVVWHGDRLFTTT